MNARIQTAYCNKVHPEQLDYCVTTVGSDPNVYWNSIVHVHGDSTYINRVAANDKPADRLSGVHLMVQVKIGQTNAYIYSITKKS